MSTEDPQKRNSHDGMSSHAMPLAVGVFWILPMLLIATLTRFAVDSGPSFLPQQSRPISLSFDERTTAIPNTESPQRARATDRESSPPSVQATNSKETTQPSFLSNKPFSYQEVRTIIPFYSWQNSWKTEQLVHLTTKLRFLGPHATGG